MKSICMYTYMILCMLCTIFVSSFPFFSFVFFFSCNSFPFISIIPATTPKNQRIKLKGTNSVEMRSVIFWYKTSHQIKQAFTFARQFFHSWYNNGNDCTYSRYFKCGTRSGSDGTNIPEPLRNMDVQQFLLRCIL